MEQNTEQQSYIEGAGIKLLPSAQVIISGILCIYDNIASQGAGIYQINNFQIPSDTFDIVTECTFYHALGTIIFSGNRATKGGSDAYGLIF